MADEGHIGREGAVNTWKTATGLLEGKSLDEIGESFKEKPKGFMDTVKGWFSSRPSAPAPSELPGDTRDILADKITDYLPRHAEPTAWQKFKNMIGFGESPPYAALSEAAEVAEINAADLESRLLVAEWSANHAKTNISTLNLGKDGLPPNFNITGATNVALTDPISTNAPASTSATNRIR